jgi:uracil-DNA glycosylase
MVRELAQIILAIQLSSPQMPSNMAEAYAKIIKTRSEQSDIDVDPLLVISVIAHESRWNPNAQSSDHQDLGLMQIRASNYGGNRNDLFNPLININAGTYIMMKGRAFCRKKLQREPLNIEFMALYAGESFAHLCQPTNFSRWNQFIRQQAKEPYFGRIIDFLREEAKQHSIFPPHKDTFNAFKHTPLDSVKVVCVGMDPYHSAGQAHGLAFSVPLGVPIPPSLRNIFKELKDDLGIEPPTHGCLIEWAQQGVLLLNAALTVRAGLAGSHQDIGWKIFTDNAIKLLNEQDRPIVYLLWGAFAKSKQALISNERHLVLTAAHPSPLSAYNGFFGCKHFSRANEFLTMNGMEPIDWSLE